MMRTRLSHVKSAALCFASMVVPTLPAADAEDARPNFLFAIADDASYPHMGAYGCTWVTTPGFNRVARQGLLFTHTYTPNAKCAPSRASILTGRNSWQLIGSGDDHDRFSRATRSLWKNQKHYLTYAGAACAILALAASCEIGSHDDAKNPQE